MNKMRRLLTVVFSTACFGVSNVLAMNSFNNIETQLSNLSIAYEECPFNEKKLLKMACDKLWPGKNKHLNIQDLRKLHPYYKKPIIDCLWDCKNNDWSEFVKEKIKNGKSYKVEVNENHSCNDIIDSLIVNYCYHYMNGEKIDKYVSELIKCRLAEYLELDSLLKFTPDTSDCEYLPAASGYKWVKGCLTSTNGHELVETGCCYTVLPSVKDRNTLLENVRTFKAEKNCDFSERMHRRSYEKRGEYYTKRHTWEDYVAEHTWDRRMLFSLLTSNNGYRYHLKNGNDYDNTIYLKSGKLRLSNGKLTAGI